MKNYAQEGAISLYIIVKSLMLIKDNASFKTEVYSQFGRSTLPCFENLYLGTSMK